MTRARLSASGLQAASLCAGKVRMEAGLTEAPREDAARGTMLHQYFRTTLDRSGLSADDQELLREADQLSDAALTKFREFEGIDPEEPFIEAHEVELNGLVPGHADTIISWEGGKVAAILDLKSGMGDVEEAPSSWQLAAYAALQFQVVPFEVCLVAIIQPKAFGPKVTSATYTDKQMPIVMEAIARIHDATLDPDAPLNAGPACQFCRAKVICPEYRTQLKVLIEPKLLAIHEVGDIDLVRLHTAIKFADKIRKEVSAEMTTRIERGDLPGWELKSTGSTRTVHDPLGMWRAFSDYEAEHGLKMTAAMYDACREMSWGKLEALIQERAGITAKKAKELVKNLAAPYVTETEKAKSPKLEKE